MDALIDNVARILATGHSRREAFRLIGGAFAAAVVGAITVEPLSAACTTEQFKYGAKACGSANHTGGEICCEPGTCCAIGGQGDGGPHVLNCCHPGECYCANGLCAGSANSPCPGGCTRCQG